MTAGWSIEQSGAFREVFGLAPSGSGILDGLTFASKDLIDIAGHNTGCGNPRWLETHPPAAAHALCVEQLLAAGARCVGKTITDELAFSLLGENHFYGTPLNPRAPDRVCGGSSSGSASAVACGLADFALGTDTGGSVRVPSANCGIWGFRPTCGFVSVAGVNPLAPSFDTVGVLASSVSILSRAMSVLLSLQEPAPAAPSFIFLIREAFELCDPDARAALQPGVARLLQTYGERVREVSIRDIDADASCSDLSNWFEIYRILQRAEAHSCLGAWIAAENPPLGPTIAESFELSRTLDRSLVPPMLHRREEYAHRMKAWLGKLDLLCIPTAPSPAPLKGSIRKREQSKGGYYPRALAMTAIAGVTRSPQVTIPAAEVSGAPLGLSFIGRSGEDAFLLGCAEGLTKILS